MQRYEKKMKNADLFGIFAVYTYFCTDDRQ